MGGRNGALVRIAGWRTKMRLEQDNYDGSLDKEAQLVEQRVNNMIKEQHTHNFKHIESNNLLCKNIAAELAVTRTDMPNERRNFLNGGLSLS